MALNYSTLVYLPVFEMLARTIVVTPIASQPGVPAYTARGIYDTDETDVMALDSSIISEQRTELYIREAEFTVLPGQNDLVEIPADDDIPGEGVFEIKDISTNGGGESRLIIRKLVTATP